MIRWFMSTNSGGKRLAEITRICQNAFIRLMVIMVKNYDNNQLYPVKI